MPNSDGSDVGAEGSGGTSLRRFESRAVYIPSVQGSAEDSQSALHHLETIQARHMPRPQELPSSPPYFTNRDRELNELDQALTKDRGSRLPIFVITGTGGIGKTALAVWWSRRLSGHFRDGVLFVDMGAFNDMASLSAQEVLAHFLRSLGTPPESIPMAIDERAALFRSVTGAKELLIVIDNAASTIQVRHLLPASTRCAVVVTSRARLEGLIINGARVFNLDRLDEVSGSDLISKMIGMDRLSNELTAVSRVVRLCGGLPLALCMAAARLVSRPRLTVGKVADDLSEERSRLGALSLPDEVSIQMVFDLSYKGLSADAAGLYRLLGLHPGNSFDLQAAAAMANRPTRTVENLLDILVGANLIEELEGQRYKFHDLVRLHARQHAEAEDDDEDRSVATNRMLDYYIFLASQADEIINLLGRSGDPVELVPRYVPHLESHADAIDWLRNERHNLLSAINLAVDADEVRRATRLARATVYYLRLNGLWSEALDLCQRAAELCSRIDDPSGLADMRFYCGDIYRLAGALSEARIWYESALAIYRELGERFRLARVMHSLGDIERVAREYSKALDEYESALAIYREIPHPHAEARALHSIADTYLLGGREEEALNLYRQIWETYRELNDEVGQARVIHSVGEIIARSDDYSEALQYYNRALTAYKVLGDHLGEADVLKSLGDVHVKMQRMSDAVRFYNNSAIIYGSLGNQKSEADSLHHLGRSLALLGRREEALENLRSALTIFQSIALEEADAVQGEIADLLISDDNH